MGEHGALVLAVKKIAIELVAANVLLQGPWNLVISRNGRQSSKVCPTDVPLCLQLISLSM